jgi:hypothetical protein
MSDFEAQSFSIIKSTKLWDQFRQEAKERGVTTTAGLREMLKEMYMKDCEDKGHLDVMPKQSDEKSIGAKGSRIPWLSSDACEEDQAEGEYFTRMSLKSRQESYRERIRGNTDGIMSLYETESNSSNKKGASNVRLARMGTGLSLSMPCIASLKEERGDQRARQMIMRKSLIGGVGRNVENLHADDTEQVELATEGETGDLHTCDSDKDGMNLARHQDLTSNAQVQHEDDNREMPAFLQNEQGSEDVSYDNSDDDRSNNGQFEYPVSREDALERRRRRAKDGDIFQSLPTNCERWIGMSGVPLSDDKGSVQLDKKDVSKSMPPSNVFVSGWDDYDKDALIDELFAGQQKTMSTCMSINKDVSCMNQEVQITAGSYDVPFSSNCNPHCSQSLPLNCQRCMGVNVDSDSDSREGSVCRLGFEKRLNRSHHLMSRSLPPKQGQKMRPTSNLLKGRQHTLSTDESSQYTAGSFLLVEWGDRRDSSGDEIDIIVK